MNKKVDFNVLPFPEEGDTFVRVGATSAEDEITALLVSWTVFLSLIEMAARDDASSLGSDATGAFSSATR